MDEVRSEGEDRSQRIRAAIDGDHLALTLLLTEAEGHLRGRLAGRIPQNLRSVVDVDDLLQEAHADAFRHIGRFELRDEPAFDRWLATLALRRLREKIRRRRTAKRGDGRAAVQRLRPGVDESSIVLLNLIESSDRSPSKSAAGREAMAAVQAALQELPENYRAAVQAVYLDGCTVAEAGRTLGCTERAVHNLCYKAKQRLRDLLGTSSRFLSSTG